VRINPADVTRTRRRREVGRLALAFLAALATIAALADSVTYSKLTQPAPEPCKSLDVRSASAQVAPLRVTFMGVTTILLDDGETAVMTDGFFSRPALKTLVLGNIKPDQTRINYALSKAGITKLASVLTAHSHHDHAMDSPEVARRTGALLIGSESTAYIARGANFPEDRIRVISGGETFTFGRFKITVIKSSHSPGGLLSRLNMGDIKAPLRPPVRASEYKEGGSYSYLIEHDGRRILVHASANYVPDFMRSVRADVIFLGVGRLGKQGRGFAKRYWREVVQATGAGVIIPIHWDDFTMPLDEPPRPMPRPLDNIKGGMKTLRRLAEANHVTVRMMQPFEPVTVSELIGWSSSSY
jgi:L-ascorbate metabolism protein UlaG (beta-lactamase superfamily)